MFSTMSIKSTSSLFSRNNKLNNKLFNNQQTNFLRTTQQTFTQRNFTSGKGFSLASKPISTPPPSLLINKLKEEEIIKKTFNLSNNWLMALAAIFGFSAMSLLSADEKEETTEKKEEVPVALSPSEWRAFTLSDIVTVNHNTKLFRFKFDDENQVAGMNVASCLVVRVYNEETKEFDVRPYTPVSSPDSKGYLDLIVKKYDTGKVTPKIFALNVGDKLEFQGAFTKLEYKPNMKKEIGMIAGGTGITPMLQVLKEILKNKEDKTKVSLIFANISEEDILLKKELDLLASLYDNFKVYYTLDRPSENWTQGKGFISEEMIKENLSEPSDDKMVFVCGPDPMVRFIAGAKGPNYTQGDLTGLLAKLGYTQDQVYKF